MARRGRARSVVFSFQAEHLILITDNRNLDSENSLEATIRRNNTPESLPIFTIADVNEF